MALAAAAAALVLGGCGADEERAQPAPSGSTSATSTGSTAGSTATGTIESTETGTSTSEDGETGTSTSEDGEGGAGDEQPIASEVRVEGRNGALSPRRIDVPPFIAVRLELRSRDERRYRLRVAGRTLAAGPGRRARVTLDGLAPERSYVLRGLDGLDDVRIVASGEAGG